MLGAVAGARAYLANTNGETIQAAEFARQALDHLPTSSNFSCSLRSVATSILGDASWLNENLEEARLAYLDAVQIGREEPAMKVIAGINLAGVIREQGQLHLAARIYRDILEEAISPDGTMLPVADRALFGLAKIYYEWNQLETAGQYISRCIQLCERRGNYELLVEAHAILARLEQVARNPTGSQQAARTAEQWQCAAISAGPDTRSKQISHLSIQQGNLEPTASIIQKSGILAQDEILHKEI
jgi:LuxR family maltose regulon positive regulatory protein